MNYGQLHIAFKILMDKSDIIGYPSFEPEEIDFYLNKAVSVFVKTRYSGLNEHLTGFQQSEKRDSDLRGTLKTYIKSFEDKPVSIDIVKPYDLWFVVGEDITIKSDNPEWPTGTYTPDGEDEPITGPLPKIVDALECTIENFTSEKNNYLSEYRLHGNYAKPLRLSVGNKIHLETDGNYYFDMYKMMYICEPELINYQIPDQPFTYINSQAHDEIVSIAVRLALENVSDPRYQTQSIENKIME